MSRAWFGLFWDVFFFPFVLLHYLGCMHGVFLFV